MLVGLDWSLCNSNIVNYYIVLICNIACIYIAITNPVFRLKSFCLASAGRLPLIKGDYAQTTVVKPSLSKREIKRSVIGRLNWGGEGLAVEFN